MYLPIEILRILHLVISSVLPERLVELHLQIRFDSGSVDSYLGFSGEPFGDGIFEARIIGICIKTLNGSFSVRFFSNDTNIISEIILDGSCHNFRGRGTSSIYKDDDLPSCEIDQILSLTLHFGNSVFVLDMYDTLSFRYEVIEHRSNFIETSPGVISEVDDDFPIAWILCYRSECLNKGILHSRSKGGDFYVLVSEIKFLIFYVIDGDFCSDNREVELLHSTLDVNPYNRSTRTFDFVDSILECRELGH